jgi:hypothetical protein
MRLRILLPALAVVATLALPSATSARQSRGHEHGHRGSHQILGTWSVTVAPDGQAFFQALLTIHAGGGLTETESDEPGTALGAWEQVGGDRYQIAFETFIYTATGAPGGHVIVRSLDTINHEHCQGRSSSTSMNRSAASCSRARAPRPPSRSRPSNDKHPRNRLGGSWEARLPPPSVLGLVPAGIQ